MHSFRYLRVTINWKNNNYEEIKLYPQIETNITRIENYTILGNYQLNSSICVQDMPDNQRR